MLHIVLLSGGSGSRLWPLSNGTRSKQFLKVLRNSQGEAQSMVQRTFERIRNLDAEANIIVETCASQVASIEAQISGEYDIVIEPERRNTAPAIMLACASLRYRRHAALQDTVIVMPIDTYAQESYYRRIIDVDKAVQQGKVDLVLLGVSPTYPAESLGYILPDSDGFHVQKFVEKPEKDAAVELIDRGALWNCGVFGFKLDFVINKLESYIDAASFDDVVHSFSSLPKSSFDYEIVEKADSIGVLAFSGEWKDLGTWGALTEEMSDYCSGRAICDDTCDNTYIVNETGLPMAVAGIRNAVVVATPDGILVSDRERSAGLKDLISQVAETRPMYESRQWGEYAVLAQDAFGLHSRSLVKMLTINSGKQLSYQLHRKRSEIWTIIDGEGEAVLNGVVQSITTGSVVVIDALCKHAVRALSKLSIVEVQLGSELTEEDIERFGFFWKVSD